MPDSVDEGARTNEPFLEMDTNADKGGSLSSTVLIVTVILVFLFVGFCVFYKYSLRSRANDRQAALDNLVTEINSQKNQAVEKKADSIKSAVSILRTASRSKYSFKGFMDELKKKITNDTKINNLSIDSNGLVTIDGQSKNYRSVADLAVSLESSDKIDDVEVSGLAQSSDSSGLISFTITAKINNWNQATTTAATGTGSSQTTEGGTSE